MSEIATLPAAEFSGLTSAEVAARKARGETNSVKFASSRSYGRIVFDNTANPVNLILFAISVLLVALGLTGDAVLTAGLVVGNVVVGVFQEGRAKHQLDRIALLTKPTATVVRDGLEQTIAPEEIVLGDLLVARAGDQVLADGVIRGEEGLSVDESLLTGESDVVRKRVDETLHSGSYVMTGSSRYEVQQVGSQRLAQQITDQARTFKKVRTPLQREVSLMIWLTAGLVALLGIEVLNTFRDIYGEIPLVEGARAAAVIVALVPQGLWFMVTVTYAMAIVRMARTGALIQRLNAVESMSHVDVLCFDKTGTLTTNTLKVEAVEPVGLDEDELRRRLGSFAASASFSNRTNEAILEACPGKAFAATAEVVFDSKRKWSALVFDTAERRGGTYVLGAPEVLEPFLQGFAVGERRGWKASATGVEATGVGRTEIGATGLGGQEGKKQEGSASDSREDDGRLDLEQWTSKGLRVLVFAHYGQTVSFDEKEPELPKGLQTLGIVVLSDQLRPDAAETIAKFNESGITLKMISGDHPDTVTALARQAGFPQDSTSVSGMELEQLAPERWARVAQEGSIFGRITPQQKEQLVQTLQASGKYVAMIGDGVNDVPSLKAAQVAVSMRSASPVTRSVADIVLLQDSFSVLPAAFTEGRRIRNGMVGIVKLFLVRVLSVTLIILGAALLQQEFPVSPRHTALIAALTVGIPSLGLATWARPGRTAKYLLPGVIDFVLPASVCLGLAGVVMYWGYLEDGATVERARTVLTATASLCGIMLIPFAANSPKEWLTRAALLDDLHSLALAGLMLVLLATAFAIEPLRRFYEIEALSVGDWGVVVVAVVSWAGVLKVLWLQERTSWLHRALERWLER